MTRSLRSAVVSLGFLVCALETAIAQVYVGGTAGRVSADLACGGIAISCETGDSGYKVFAGYGFSPNLSVEAAYLDLGKTSTVIRSGPRIPGTGRTSFSETAKGYGVFVVGALYPVERVAIFGKLGLAGVNVKYAETFGRSSSETTTGPAFGLGASFSLTKNLSIRAEWDRLTATYFVEESDVDLVSAGLKFSF
jgi:OOP family OmpA-OmpF porin